MHVRKVFAGLLAVAAVVVVAGCGGDDKKESSTTTTTEERIVVTTTTAGAVGNVLPPVVLTPQETTANVAVGTIVTFNMGDPGQGKFVATSNDPAVFAVESDGETRGTATFNAAGKAVAPGITSVSVSFVGSTNGVGTPTIFNIKVY